MWNTTSPSKHMNLSWIHRGNPVQRGAQQQVSQQSCCQEIAQHNDHSTTLADALVCWKLRQQCQRAGLQHSCVTRFHVSSRYRCWSACKFDTSEWWLYSCRQLSCGTCLHGGLKGIVPETLPDHLHLCFGGEFGLLVCMDRALSLSVCVSVCLSVCLSVCPCVFVSVSVCLSV